MQIAEGTKRRRVDPKLAILAILVLILCLFFPINFALWSFDAGFTLNSRWVVIEVTYCEDHPELCDGHRAAIQIGDRIKEFNGFTFENFETDRAIDPFRNTKPGDTLEIVLERDAVQHVIQWKIPEQNPFSRLVSLIAPIFVFGPFWLAGSVILLFMRPHSSQWRLLVLMNYLTAFWLATGIYSNYRVLYSSLLLHAVSWLMLPVFLNLHLIVPSPLFGKRTKYILWALYAVAIFMAVLELLLIPPQSVFMISILLIAFGSIGILLYRVASKTTTPADKTAAKLMLTGIALALIPGIVIWMIPTLINIDPPGVLSTSVAMLALPLLPLFYTYSVFKRRLGEFEVRLNRLIAIYTIFIIYLLILSIALFFRASIPTPSNLIFGFYLVVVLAIALTVFPVQELFRRIINRLAYGSDFNPDEMYNVFASEISASADMASLVHILEKEIMPPLRIRQSALLIRDEEGYVPVYLHNLEPEQVAMDFDEISALIISSGNYHPPLIEDEDGLETVSNWVRLSITLERRSVTVGLWLFGNRDPDDFYARKDIDLLQNLAIQVAIAAENMRLLQDVQNELAERKLAEQALKNYADRLELMHEIDQAILEVSSSKEIAQAALDRLQKLIPFSRGSVLFYELGAREAELLAVSGRTQNTRVSEEHIVLDPSSMLESLKNGRVWMANDLSIQFSSNPNARAISNEGILAVICAPLMASGELIGSLNLGSEHPSGFDLEHRDIAMEVADSLAIAIHSARLFETVTSHSIEMQSLSARLLSVQEEERKHISYELHDEIGQVLTAITYNLSAIRRNIPEPISEKAADRLSDSEELVHKVMERIRDISLQLRPSMLEDLGLIPTLRWYINQYGERTNINVEFSAGSVECPFHESTETALYRFVQEGLTNTARHAQANNISVTLECEGEMIQATVKDDGIGFDPDGSDDVQTSLAGTGLLGIRERLAPLGGQLRVNSVIGQGTTIQARIPMGKLDEED